MKRRQGAKTADDSELELARKRVHRLATPEIYDWVDVAGSGIYQALGDYRTHGSAASLEEISRAVTCLRAVVDELADRHDPRP